MPRLPPVSRDALRVWGVDPAAEASIRATCASFVRVSPVNLVLSGLLRRLLNGERPAGTSRCHHGLDAAGAARPLPSLANSPRSRPLNAAC